MRILKVAKYVKVSKNEKKWPSGNFVNETNNLALFESDSVLSTKFSDIKHLIYQAVKFSPAFF